MSEKEIKEKRERFERSFKKIKSKDNFVYVRVASATIYTTSYEFRGSGILFLYNEDKLVAIVYNIMDIDGVS